MSLRVCEWTLWAEPAESERPDRAPVVSGSVGPKSRATVSRLPRAVADLSFIAGESTGAARRRIE